MAKSRRRRPCPTAMKRIRPRSLRALERNEPPEFVEMYRVDAISLKGKDKAVYWSWYTLSSFEQGLQALRKATVQRDFHAKLSPYLVACIL